MELRGKVVPDESQYGNRHTSVQGSLWSNCSGRNEKRALRSLVGSSRFCRRSTSGPIDGAILSTLFLHDAIIP